MSRASPIRFLQKPQKGAIVNLSAPRVERVYAGSTGNRDLKSQSTSSKRDTWNQKKFSLVDTLQTLERSMTGKLPAFGLRQHEARF